MCNIKEENVKPRLHVSVNLAMLAMITMRKFIDGFPFLSHMSMGLRLAVLRAAGAPLKSIDTSLAVKGLRGFPLTSKSVWR